MKATTIEETLQNLYCNLNCWIQYVSNKYYCNILKNQYTAHHPWTIGSDLRMARYYYMLLNNVVVVNIMNLIVIQYAAILKRITVFLFEFVIA